MTITIPVDATLAEIVNEHPDLVRELERRSLDYCCGGQRSLTEACADLGIDPQATAEELGQVTVGPKADWADLGPAGLADHIESTHHAYLHEELPRLSDLAAKVAGVHGDRHPELVTIERTYGELRADLEPHLAKEELILFPMIRQLAESGERPSFHCGRIEHPISVMLADHDRAGELLAELGRLSDGFAIPDDACASYTALYDGLRELDADTRLHVHKENNILFPAALALDASLEPVE